MLRKQDEKPVETAPADVVATTPRGPRPLDPALLRHVGGGAPRGGWLGEEAVKAAPDSLAPRGGW